MCHRKGARFRRYGFLSIINVAAAETAMTKMAFRSGKSLRTNGQGEIWHAYCPIVVFKERKR